MAVFASTTGGQGDSAELKTSPLITTEGLDNVSASRFGLCVHLSYSAGAKDSEESPGNVPERAYRALSCTRTQNDSETTRSESFPFEKEVCIMRWRRGSYESHLMFVYIK